MEKFIKRQEQLHKANLKHLYGMTREEYNTLFKKQKGCCAICNAHQTELSRKLSVDHCHMTGKIRGLLCDTCNLGLGLFKDKTNLLDRAKQYLNSK